jgi:hypothetical protein
MNKNHSSAISLGIAAVVVLIVIVIEIVLEVVVVIAVVAMYLTHKPVNKYTELNQAN